MDELNDLLGQRTQLNEMLAHLPDASVIERQSLEARLADVEVEIARAAEARIVALIAADEEALQANYQFACDELASKKALVIRVEGRVAVLETENARLRAALADLLTVFVGDRDMVEIEVAEEYQNQPASARHHMGPLYPDDQARVRAARAALGEGTTSGKA